MNDKHIKIRYKTSGLKFPKTPLLTSTITLSLSVPIPLRFCMSSPAASIIFFNEVTIPSAISEGCVIVPQGEEQRETADELPATAATGVTRAVQIRFDFK